MQQWISELGYARYGKSLFKRSQDVPATHRYASELRALLDQDGLIRARAVFDVDGTPTVAFVEARSGDALAQIRQRIWNQNLVTIVLELDDQDLCAYSPHRDLEPRKLSRTDASVESAWSAHDVQSGEVAQRLPEWFNAQQRVDRDLLRNLGTAVTRLEESGLSRDAAQYLMGQLLFVSYLEHRGIVSDTYRGKHEVGSLPQLIQKRDRMGLTRLFTQLKEDFNGDFLSPKVARQAGWTDLDEPVFQTLDAFLKRVDLDSGQTSLWSYDFRFIPVELISGIYETFLGADRDALGAFYTRRHLAQLTVDFAFEGVADPAAETVYDGACGSGILLTTAFRRMLGHAHAKRKRPLNFSERIDLLKDHIFGSDLSEAACRVSAFSLYLSLLEDLVPKDLAELMDTPELKLPNLLGHNLQANAAGDFFAKNNPFAGKARYSVLLSNPPWSEADASKATTFEHWCDQANRLIVRRQIAAAYAHRAVDSVKADGRMVLILPNSLLLAPTSQPFVNDWLHYARPERIVNFGDMRRQLFDDADHGCVVVVARPRERTAHEVRIPVDETFDYWVPKVDLALAFGRLTIHNSDRAKIQTQSVVADNASLRRRTWGTTADVRFVRRLLREGTLSDYALDKGWHIGKGFNRTRHSSPKLPPGRLASMRYLHANSVPRSWPVIPEAAMQPFPKEIETVVSYGSQNGVAFKGPRVVYPDGLSNQLEMRAAYLEDECCFQHTIAAVVGKPDDEDILRFLAIYLRSPLARYLIMQTAYSPAAERERITVSEVNELPFPAPTNSARKRIIARVGVISRALEKQLNKQVLVGEPDLDEAYKLVEEYMGLSEAESGLVHDITKWALPSRQGSTTSGHVTPWQSVPAERDVKAYARALRDELKALSIARRGMGSFEVSVVLGRRLSKRGVGLVEIVVHPGTTKKAPSVSDQSLQAVEALIDGLASDGVLPMQVTEDMFLVGDICVLRDNRAYLVKPLVRRLWRVGAALDDAIALVDKAGNEG